MPLLGVILSGCMTLGAATIGAEEPADELFEKHEVVTGTGGRQTVLSGFFLGGATAELAVVRVDRTGGPRVHIYGLEDGAWARMLEATLRPDVLFVDVAEIGGRDRLITYESGRLSWFDPDSSTQRALVSVKTSYRRATSGKARKEGAIQREIPRVDITRDLNRDGRDDLVLPDVDGFWVSTQLSDGSFTEAMKLGPPEPFRGEILGEVERRYGEAGINAQTIPWYLSRVHEMDYDQDGRSDLVFWNEDHFEVHLQDERGLFSPLAGTFTTEVPFDSDGAYSLLFGFDDESMFSLLLGLRAKTTRTILHSFRDLSGDGVADLVTQTITGRSVLRQRSLYEVHFGKPTPNGVVFPREVGIATRPRGRAGGLQASGYASQDLRDFDGDGLVDIMFSEVRIGIGGMLRALVGNSVPLDLEIYRSAGGVYPDDPAARRRIRRCAPFAGLGNVFFPAVLMGDVNGDGRSDLLVGHSPKELRVYLGVSGSDLLARRPLKVAVALPSDERNARLVDLNKDGKQDLLVHLAPTHHAPDRPHRLTTLIAR